MKYFLIVLSLLLFTVSCSRGHCAHSHCGAASECSYKCGKKDGECPYKKKKSCGSSEKKKECSKSRK